MTTEILPATQKSKQTAPSRLWIAIVAVYKLVLGVALCQTALGSILVIGWTYRWAQRAILKKWWQLSKAGQGGSGFDDFLGNTSNHQHLHRPNWFVQQNARIAFAPARQPFSWGNFRQCLRAAVWSLGRNLRIGIQAILNTWVLTLPPCALWLFAWYDGWNNSFTKGYEQAAVGPVTGLSGVFLFIAVMLYLPMAQMRQASTGCWRSFYQFATVWKLVQRRWLACLGLAMLYAAMSFPLMVLKLAPGFFPQINPRLAAFSNAEALHFLNVYYFWAGFLFFPSYVVLRLAAARIYAAALVACWQTGALTEDALAENEWEALHALDLLAVPPRRPRHFMVRTLQWVGTRAGKLTVGFALFLVWFAFVAQIFISEFVRKTDHGRGWLNQPLVQLPWFHYAPAQLSGPEGGSEP